MRKLLAFTIGFVAACAIGIYALPAQYWLIFCIGAIPVCICAFLFYRKHRMAARAAVVLLGLVAGFGWLFGYDALYYSTARAYDNGAVTACVTATDYSTESDYGRSVDGRILLDGRTYKIRLYLQGGNEICPGDTITGEIRLRVTLPETENTDTYQSGNGVFLIGYGDETMREESAEKISLRYFPAVLRHKILKLLDDSFPEDTVSFARALLLGDGSLLSYETNTALKLSGIRHVIAVSGLHVSILICMVLFLTGHQRGFSALLGIPVLLLFTALAGFTPSVVRACTMQCLYMVALLLDRQYDSPSALSTAVLIMLLINPMSVTSVSLQLSVSCIIGILLFQSRIHNFLMRGYLKEHASGRSLRAKLIRWTVSTVSVSLSATIFTIPLSAFYFHTVSLVSVLTNLLTLWVVSFVFYGCMLVCAAGAIWAPLGSVIAAIISWPIRYIIGVAKILSKFPLAAVYTESIYIVIWLIVAYGLFILLSFGKNKRPVMTVSCICALLAVCLSASYLEIRTDSFQVSVLDVGEGQCIHVHNRDGDYLIDCGGDSKSAAADTAAQYLLSKGIFRLDGLILTHYDADHAQGVPLLLSRISADTLYLPDTSDAGTVRQTLTADYGDQICWVKKKTAVSGENSLLTIIPAEGETEDNNSSLCILFQMENCDILITGDRSSAGEKELLAGFNLPQLDILVAGHHGAENATSFALLSQTKPRYAAISAGADGRYGHPAQATLDRLKFFKADIYRTDEQGTIVFRG